jgi:acyl-CoA reductase-like NAD-dependent aldehyde dehydrogenase
MPAKILTSFIDGSWLSPVSKTIVARNPGRLAREASRWSPASRTQARDAMEAAAQAWPAWAATRPRGRIELLDAFLKKLGQDSSALADTITRENGKTLRESRAEIRAALADARHLLKSARAAMRRPAPNGSKSRHGLVHEPVGVYMLVTPWNFPLATIIRKIIPALAFGNTVILKPSRLTPATAVKVVGLMAEVPFSSGTVNLVLGTGGGVGPALVGHPALRGLSFTGSNPVGLELARQTAGRDVRLQLEMGGKNSLIVLADAGVDQAVEAAITGGFSCAGQWCTGTGRIIVEDDLYQLFCDKLVTRTTQLKVGPGDVQSVQVGPVISADRVRFAKSSVREAVTAGATIACGGDRPALRKGWKGHFFAPTVLTEVTEKMDVFKNELFVPILPVVRAADYSDALRLANSGPYGLSASIFTTDRIRADHFLQHIEAGIAHVNLHTALRIPELPVAGWRDSGRGIPECGDYAADFFARPRAVYL